VLVAGSRGSIRSQNAESLECYPQGRASERTAQLSEERSFGGKAQSRIRLRSGTVDATWGVVPHVKMLAKGDPVPHLFLLAKHWR